MTAQLPQERCNTQLSPPSMLHCQPGQACQRTSAPRPPQLPRWPPQSMLRMSASASCASTWWIRQAPPSSWCRAGLHAVHGSAWPACKHAYTCNEAVARTRHCVHGICTHLFARCSSCPSGLRMALALAAPAVLAAPVAARPVAQERPPRRCWQVAGRQLRHPMLRLAQERRRRQPRSRRRRQFHRSCRQARPAKAA